MTSFFNKSWKRFSRFFREKNAPDKFSTRSFLGTCSIMQGSLRALQVIYPYETASITVTSIIYIHRNLTINVPLHIYISHPNCVFPPSHLWLYWAGTEGGRLERATNSPNKRICFSPTSHSPIPSIDTVSKWGILWRALRARWWWWAPSGPQILLGLVFASM